jgi:hypothetical protein
MTSRIRLTLFALVLAFAGSAYAEDLTSQNYRIVSNGTGASSSVTSNQWMDKGTSQYGSYHVVGKTFPSTPRTASTPFPENSPNPQDLLGTNFGLDQGFLYTLFNFNTASTTRFTDNSGTDVTQYEIGNGDVYVTVTDSDENTDSNSAQTVSVVITCAASGDSETITLTETGNNTGVFRNTTGIASALPPATQENGIIETAGGSEIVATYTDNDDPSDTSNDTATMTNGLTPPAAPTLVSPADGSFTNDPTTSFDWSDSTGADTYILQIDDANDFVTPIIVKTGIATSEYTLSGTPPEFLADGQYWWRVFAVNGGGSSPASGVWDLTVDTEPPVITRFTLSDTTCPGAVCTDSATVTCGISEDDATPIVRWLLVNDPSSLETPTVQDMLSNGLSARPSTWDFPATEGRHTVALWVMDSAQNISPARTASMEYVIVAGGVGIVAPPGGFVVRPMVPLCLEVVGFEEPITWSVDRGTIIGNSPTATYYNKGPAENCTITVHGIHGGEMTMDQYHCTTIQFTGGIGAGSNLSGSHTFDIPVARTYSGKGFLLNLSLHYNSHAQEPREYTGYSYNWTHSYDIFIHRLKKDRIELKDGTGGRVVFCLRNTNPPSWDAYDIVQDENPYGNYSVVEAAPSGGATDPEFGLYHYKMTTKARTEYFFREMLNDNVEENYYGLMDSPAYCVGIRDTNGNIMQFAYETASDGDPNPWMRTILTSVTDTAGRSITFEYEQPVVGGQTQAGQRISRITDPNGNITVLAYNADSFLQSVTEGGSVWSFTWYPVLDCHRLMETKTDPNANVSRYVFEVGKIFIEEYLNGRLTLRTDRNTVPTGSPTTITNANGDERIEAFEPWDNTWSNITDEEGFTITNTFDNWRNLLTEDVHLRRSGQQAHRDGQQ